MVEVHTSEVEVKLAPVSHGLLRVKFYNHGSFIHIYIYLNLCFVTSAVSTALQNNQDKKTLAIVSKLMLHS
jgi:hypothetical protein